MGNESKNDRVIAFTGEYYTDFGIILPFFADGTFSEFTIGKVIR